MTIDVWVGWGLRWMKSFYCPLMYLGEGGLNNVILFHTIKNYIQTKNIESQKEHKLKISVSKTVLTSFCFVYLFV